MKYARPILFLLFAAAAFAAALAFDHRINRAVEAVGWPRTIARGWRADLLRMPGNVTLGLTTLVALAVVHRRRIWATATMLVSIAVAGTIVGIMKGVFGRARPGTWPGTPEWVIFRGGWHGFWHQTNVSFVSGDVTQAFAWATALGLAVPVLRTPAYAWALLTAVQRVLAGAHWPSDTVAAAILGTVTAHGIARILSGLLPPPTDGPAPKSTPRPRAEPAVMPDIDAPYVSLVIPCYNEQENVPTLLSRVEASMEQVGRPYEVLIVDDGSTDRTPHMLAEAKQTKPWLRVLRMAKNSGQSAGFEAGFAAAKGRYIATIDADLQNDPEEVPRLVKLLDESPDYDMITGWRKDRQDTNFRRWQSRQANKIRNWISQDNINDSACSLKIYKAETLRGLKLFNGAHRFFPALVKMRGYRVLEVPVKHSQRFAGTAKYGFRNRAFRAFIDLLGVRWMKMRYLSYQANEHGGNHRGGEQSGQETSA